MPGNFTVINMRKFLVYEEMKFGKDRLGSILSTYKCDLNPEIERFLKDQSVDFTKKNQSVTYLVFSNNDDSLVGYFTLTIKPITVSEEAFSKTVMRKIARMSKKSPETDTYTFSAYLIAQLGKNFYDDNQNKIAGTELLQAAIEKIQEVQAMVGGTVVFLEAEDNQKVIAFYEEQNNFKKFGEREFRTIEGNSQRLIQLLRIL